MNYQAAVHVRASDASWDVHDWCTCVSETRLWTCMTGARACIDESTCTQSCDQTDCFEDADLNNQWRYNWDKHVSRVTIDRRTRFRCLNCCIVDNCWDTWWLSLKMRLWHAFCQKTSCISANIWLSDTGEIQCGCPHAYLQFSNMKISVSIVAGFVRMFMNRR